MGNGLSDAVRMLDRKRRAMPKPLPGSNRRPELVVACILDPFSYACFRHECQLVPLKAYSWWAQMEEIAPVFLFVESAWSGADGSWKNELNDKRPGDFSQLFALLDYCLERGIPTVFWNKEDPPHYTQFIETAKRFDYIFTTDADCVDKYKKEAGKEKVYVLPFAAQPALHNPIGSSYRSKLPVAFAGSYYKDRYPERLADVPILLEPAMAHGLHIYDRHYGSPNPSYHFPPQYAPCMLPGLAYGEMVLAYKQYKVFLNVNSAAQSPTMIARRMFELLASGTNVISTPAEGINRMLPGLVPIAAAPSETHRHLAYLLQQQEVSERLSLLGVRHVYDYHLYKHRFDVILDKLGMSTSESEGVTVVAWVRNPVQARYILERYYEQSWLRKELVLLVGREDLLQLRESLHLHHSSITIVLLRKEESFGQGLRYAMTQSRYNYMSLFRENCYYAPHYLKDLMHAAEFSNASIVGKGAYYSFGGAASNRGLTLQREELQNLYATTLSDGAWIVAKELFTRVSPPEELGVPFQQFLQRCMRLGVRLYSADKFNYIEGLRGEGNDWGKMAAAAEAELRKQVTV
ncbi:CgeB family protein [Paenibacillus koleovorans]|uniref:CgeB family protein n=1 Tax=Paenibacillus koleovorans TaxID=121608 RepID=UPI000FDBDDA4|nr:glycosyltransferase [Paenibacillus koleovorans]